MILEPIFEADFYPCSHGFRRNRSTHTALRDVARAFPRTTWTVEGDIVGCFDNIPHGKLMKAVERRIADEKVLGLIRAFLAAGYMEQWQYHRAYSGTPQGGVLSPLLANIYLHEWDKYMGRYTELPKGEWEKRERRGVANFLYVRYANGFVALGDGSKEQAEALRQELYEVLKDELKLELSMGQTKVTHASGGFMFLGYLIDRNLTGSGRWAPRIRIPAKAVEKVQAKLRAALSPRTHKDSVRVKSLALNRIIGGWCRYYQRTSSPNYYFDRLSDEIYWAMAHWLSRKYQMSIKRVMKQYRKGNTYGTDRITLIKPSDFKAELHRLRTITNSYTSETP